MAKASKLTGKKLTEMFSAFRKELVCGDEQDIQAYLVELAAIAANAHRVDGSFKRWSHRNRVMLDCQRRHFGESHQGLYAGKNQWNKIDRGVKPGAKAKYIWAASGGGGRDTETQKPKASTPDSCKAVDDIVKQVDESAGDKEDDNSQPTPTKHRFGGFKLVEVFDWSDTVALNPDEEEPDWQANVCGDISDVTAALEKSFPLPVEFCDLGGVRAHGTVESGRLVIKNNLSDNAVAVELARWHAHHTLGTLSEFASCVNDPEANSPRTTRECEATLAGAMVCVMLGVCDTNVVEEAANWLRTFHDPQDGVEITGHKRRLKLLSSKLDLASETADKVVAKATKVHRGSKSGGHLLAI